MFKRKSKQPQPVPEPKSSPPLAPPEQKELQSPTFTEIGGSPVPGFTLRHVLRGHTDQINRITWAPDGSYLASPSNDDNIRIWDTRSGECVRTLQGHSRGVLSVAWSPDGQRLASSSHDETIRLWDTASGMHLQTLEGHT